jgi:hypothetical protein
VLLAGLSEKALLLGIERFVAHVIHTNFASSHGSEGNWKVFHSGDPPKKRL